ncbi:MAG: hypothetical protein K6B75_06390 [Lachnospiraceae bacterium]|nr:hypothetical protein [Lachnospiraceae bacterium]
MRQKKFIPFLAACLAVSLSLTGCQKTETKTELTDSVKGLIDIAKVEFGSLSDVTYYELTAVGDTEEIGLSENARLREWLAAPGDTVKKDQIIAVFEKDLDENKTVVQKTDVWPEEAYKIVYAKLEYEIEYAKFLKMKEEKTDKNLLALQEIEVEKKKIYLDKMSSFYPEYADVEPEEMLGGNAEETTNGVGSALSLQNGNETVYVKAPFDGTITYRSSLMPGDSAYAGACVLAVTSKDVVLRGEYILEGTLKKAESIYAYINGEKTELKKLPYTAEDYAGKYARFTADNLPAMGEDVGAYIVTNVREDVLYIPIDALCVDKLGYYVNVYTEDGNKEKRYIEISNICTEYAEVSYGLKEGEEVIVTFTAHDGSASKTENAHYGRFSDTTQYKATKTYLSSARLYFSEESVTFGRFNVSEGDYVTAGTVIAECEVNISEEELSAKKEELEYLKKNLEIKKTAYETMKNELDFTLKEIDGYKARLDYAYLQYKEYADVVSARIETLTNEIEISEGTRTANTIVAPIDGYIDKLAYIKEGDTVTNTRWVAMIHSEAEEYLQITDRNATVNPLMKVTVMSGGNTYYEGRVVQADASLASDIRTGYAYVELTDKSVKISDLENPVVYVEKPVVENALLVSRTSVNTSKGKKYVMIVENGTAKKRYVTVGPNSSDYYVVITGLKEGDTVAIQ